jgi:catechol 2,3-dioxygenase-like lactoylglutathione lyase family enzyme
MEHVTWRFTHNHIYASDPQATVAWLVDLGGTLVGETNHDGYPTMYNVTIGGLLVQVRGQRSAEHFTPKSGERAFGLDHIGLVTDDLPATLTALRARGIEPETEFSNGFSVPDGVAFLRGPDDLWVELAPSIWYPETDFPPRAGAGAARNA